MRRNDNVKHLKGAHRIYTSADKKTTQPVIASEIAIRAKGRMWKCLLTPGGFCMTDEEYKK